DYLITYTALSQPAFGEIDGVRIGLATTRDFRSVVKHGVVGPDLRDKDAVIFPKKIDGRVVMLHRIAPDIQVVYFDSVEELCSPPKDLWDRHLSSLDDHIVMSRSAEWEGKKIGAGPTPIETSEGWLIIYHGVDWDHVYRTGLALLDLDDPRRVIARGAEPVLEPELDFELFGDVNNVVFPEGAVVIDDVLHLYYGAADRVIGHARARLADVLDYLLDR
ncbi:MAG: glycosidase, partial [Rhodothermales bacterium]|nr:glycosidase [Rhodothermales bacterium]